MDPVSFTAAGIGMFGAAISSFTRLLDLIRKIRGVDEELQDISSGLEAIITSLEALSELRDADGEELAKTNLKDAVDRCSNSCNNFRKFLNKWIDKSDNGVSFRARLSVGLFRTNQIKSLKEQVWLCQSTAQLAVTSTALLAQYRTERHLGSNLDNIGRQLQDLAPKIEDHALVIGQHQEQTELRISELDHGSEDDEDDSMERSASIREFENLLSVLEATQACIISFSQRIRSTLMRQEIGDVTTSDDSVAWVGIPESVVGKLECQRIGNVVTSTRSASYVGVFSNAQGNHIVL